MTISHDSPPPLSVSVLATLDLVRDDDVSRLRRLVATQADALGFREFDRTRLVTATSELARNALTYAGGGKARVERIDSPAGTALRVALEDVGPGIDNIEEALSDGYSSGLGLGLGLGGARRLVDDFSIDSHRGGGTRITIARWLPPKSPARRALR